MAGPCSLPCIRLPGWDPWPALGTPRVRQLGTASPRVGVGTGSSSSGLLAWGSGCAGEQGRAVLLEPWGKRGFGHGAQACWEPGGLEDPSPKESL